MHPLNQTVAEINIDGANLWGETDDVIVHGEEWSALGAYVRPRAAQLGLTIIPDAEPEKGFFFRSDHFPFAKAGVPARYVSGRVTIEFFNVASGSETTVMELALLLIRLRGREGELAPVFEAMDPGLVTRRWGCPKKARELLGFETTTSVEEGMRHVIAWRAELRSRPGADA